MTPSYTTRNQFANMCERRARDAEDLAAKLRSAGHASEANVVDAVAIAFRSAEVTLRVGGAS